MKNKEVEGGYISWLYEIDKSSGLLVGGKGANLAEMYNSKFPVPPAFIVNTRGYNYFTANIKNKIEEILDAIDVENTSQLDENAKKIREIIINHDMPEDLKEEIIEAYETLSIDKDVMKIAKSSALHILQHSQEPIFVAVRSSATTEDLAEASFAGQQESYLNVKGDKDLIEKIKRVFASLFTARAIYYRKRQGFSKEKFSLAAVVQKMVDSEKSGVMFSKNPLENNGNVVIEAVYGLGEGIVSGKIKPDNYEVSTDLKIMNKKISVKKTALVRNSQGQMDEITLDEEISKSQVLGDREINLLANYALKIEEHYGKPQDIEFAIEKGEIYITQSRPITTKTQDETNKKEIKGDVILTGQGASPGIASGKVRIIHDIKELNKVQKGDILVTEMTNPDMVVSMQKSSAIVTNEGGLTCHASIVSREMGIPAVVGTGNATEVLKDGEIISVDGFSGKVYRGDVGSVKVEIKKVVPTKTVKIKVLVDLPEAVERAKETGCDAVGLLRLEGIIASSGKHPNLFVEENNFEGYQKIIEDGIEKISIPFKEIWIRTSDIRSDEYSHLKGAPKDIELNPMLGMHGIRFSLKNLGIFKAELNAIKSISKKYPDKIFGFMMPQIISVSEVVEAKKIREELDMQNIKIGIMVETPAACFIINELLEQKVDFISFGTNDLTQYVLAVDRGNELAQYLYDEMHPAVSVAMKRVLKACQRNGVESSICGQAGSKKEMVKFLFENGIKSISVNADAVHEISSFVAEMESKQPEKINQNNKPNFPSQNKPTNFNKGFNPRFGKFKSKWKNKNFGGNNKINLPERGINPHNDIKNPVENNQKIDTNLKIVPNYVAKNIHSPLSVKEENPNFEEYTEYENNFQQKQIEPKDVLVVKKPTEEKEEAGPNSKLINNIPSKELDESLI
jgi:pyruvate, water dikinase